MCRGNDHSGRRCPSSKDKAKRSEQNRAYYLKHKSAGANAVGSDNDSSVFVVPVTGLPNPADLRDLLTRRKVRNKNATCLWSEDRGVRLRPGESSDDELVIEARRHLESIRDGFEQVAVNDTAGCQLKVNQVIMDSAVSDDSGMKVPMKVSVSGTLITSDGEVGEWSRYVYFPEDEPAFAVYESLEVYPDYQGEGLGRGVIKQFDQIMKSWGVARVEVEANVDVGGYAWAKSGYDWNRSVSKFNFDGEGLDYTTTKGWIFQQGLIWEEMKDYCEREGDPTGEVSKMIKRLQKPYDDATYPTPLEVANTGRKDGDEIWAGKAALLGSSWFGVRKL